LAAASGAIMTLFIHTVVQERLTGEVTYNLQYAMNGCLSGLVASTGIVCLSVEYELVLRNLIRLFVFFDN
jgi:Amt family ammonium transporter